MAYIPKQLNEDELKEYLSLEAFNTTMDFFKANLAKTTFKLKDNKNKVTVRRFRWDSGKVTYTIALV